MISFKRQLALTIGSVAVLLACLSILPVWWLAREQAEDKLVAVAVAESRNLLRQEGLRPEGPQALLQAQAATRALAGGFFDIAEIYTPVGALLAEPSTAVGKSLERDLPPHITPSYQQPYYESRRLPGDRWIVRLFIPLHTDHQALQAYLEGVRLIPAWQRSQIDREAWRIALLVAVAILLCGAALYPAMVRVYASAQRKTREVLESHISMMEALGRAIARRDSDDGTHNYRVAWISATLAEEVGLHGRRMQELIAGSFLHDVGKIGIPDAILLKPGRLNDEEMNIMRTHVSMGEDIVTGAGWLDGGKTVVAAHHEKWDGSGYPRGLAGEDIPLVARIFAIADVFDALCARRPYKEPMALEDAVRVLNEEAGKHFDPHLVKVFNGLAQHIHRTIVNASEREARALLEVMMRKHFAV